MTSTTEVSKLDRIGGMNVSSVNGSDQPNSSESSLGRLHEQVDALHDTVDRLATVLERQRNRRRKITLRLLLCSFVFFAAVFAWFGNAVQQSKLQARSAGVLMQSGAFIHYETRRSLLVALMPGDAQDPPRFLARALGEDFFGEVVNVSTLRAAFNPKAKKQLLEALEGLRGLRYLRLVSVNLTTSDLRFLEMLPELESLDISRTKLDRGRVPAFRNLPLRWFDASHTHFSDDAMIDLCGCTELQYLDLERTAISDEGAKHIAKLKSLRFLNLNRSPVSKEVVISLSKALPNCRILWQPLKFRGPGKQVDVAAARRGALILGTQLAPDMRRSRRAIAPFDATPNPNLLTWPR